MAFEYRNTFISVAEDCAADKAEIPPELYRGKPTIASQEFDFLKDRPFEHTMSEIQSAIWVDRKGAEDLSSDERQALLDEYFAEGRACFRASPLAKKYGWGFLFDGDGRVALIASDSSEYEQHLNDDSLTQLMAMRSSRK